MSLSPINRNRNNQNARQERQTNFKVIFSTNEVFGYLFVILATSILYIYGYIYIHMQIEISTVIILGIF